ARDQGGKVGAVAEAGAEPAGEVGELDALQGEGAGERGLRADLHVLEALLPHDAGQYPDDLREDAVRITAVRRLVARGRDVAVHARASSRSGPPDATVQATTCPSSSRVSTVVTVPPAAMRSRSASATVTSSSGRSGRSVDPDRWVSGRSVTGRSVFDRSVSGGSVSDGSVSDGSVSDGSVAGRWSGACSTACLAARSRAFFSSLARPIPAGSRPGVTRAAPSSASEATETVRGSSKGPVTRGPSWTVSSAGNRGPWPLRHRWSRTASLTAIRPSSHGPRANDGSASYSARSAARRYWRMSRSRDAAPSQRLRARHQPPGCGSPVPDTSAVNFIRQRASSV